MWKVAVLVGALASVVQAEPAAPSVKLDTVLVLGPLAQQRVIDVVEASRPALTACFDKMLVGDPSFTGARSVVAVFVLDGDGKVTRHDVITPHAGLRACTVPEAAKWRFPPATDHKSLEIELHLQFESGRPIPPPAQADTDTDTDTRVDTERNEQPEITGALDSEQIELALSRTEKAVGRCYTKELRHQPWGNDEGVVTLGISARGKLLRMHGHRLDARVERCLGKAFKLVRFPASKNGKPVMLTYPVARNEPGYTHIDTSTR